MGKPRKFGSNRGYIPNARADMRFNKKLYQRGRGYTDKHEALIHEIRQRWEQKKLEEMKHGRPAV